jgi:cytoskeleton protein RodZ
MGEFGHALRQLRQDGGISLQQLSDSTRIRVLHIEALESERFHELPSDASARGFVRLLVRQLRGNEPRLLKLFEEALIPHGPVSPPMPLAQTNTTLLKVQSGRHHAGLGIGAAMVVAVLLLFGWMRASQEPLVAQPPSAQTATTESAKVAAMVPKPPAPVASSPTVPAQSSTSTSSVATQPQPADQPRSETGATEERSGGLVSRDAVTPATLPVGGFPLRLEVAASEQSWVQAEVDSAELREVLLQPGERLLWTAKEQMKLTVGNAGGLILTFNGELIPILGETGQVVRLRFTEAGLQGRTSSSPNRSSDPPTPQTSKRPDTLPPSALAF